MSDSLWWLSFCDRSKPKGKQFLGVIIIKSELFIEAIHKTHSMCINLGGKVRGYQLSGDDVKDIKQKHIGTLLSEQRLIQLMFIDGVSSQAQQSGTDGVAKKV